MLAWSQTRLFITLAIATLIFTEPVSWMTAPLPGCIVNPENYGAYYANHNECPTFHIFLIVLVASIFERLGEPNWVIADFTVVLAFSTIGLWIVTWRASIKQSTDMQASIAVAGRAAAAAELSAQSAIGLQLPRLIVEGAALYQPGQPYGASEPYTAPIEGGMPPEWSQASIRFHNVGNTNAYLSEECTEYFVGPRLPKTPRYDRILLLPSGFVIKNGGHWEAQIGNRFVHLTAEQRRAIETIELSHSLWVYGFLRFADFLGKPHEFRFCRRWDRSSGFVSGSDTPSEYTGNH